MVFVLVIWTATSPFESDVDSARLAPADADMVLHVPSLSEFARSTLSAKPIIDACEGASDGRGPGEAALSLRRLALALAREADDRIIGFLEPTSLTAWWRAKPMRESTERRLYGRQENRRTAPFDCGMVLGIEGGTAGAICRLLRHRALFERCLRPFVSSDVGLEWQRGVAVVRAPSMLFPPGWFEEYLPPAAVHIGIRGDSIVIGTDGAWVRNALGIEDTNLSGPSSVPADDVLASFISRSSRTPASRDAAALAAQALDATALFEFLGGVPESDLSLTLRKLDASGVRMEVALGSTLANAPLGVPNVDGTMQGATSLSARDAARFLFSRLDAVAEDSVLVPHVKDGDVDGPRPITFREWFPRDARDAVLASLAADAPFHFVLGDGPPTSGLEAPRTFVPDFAAAFTVADRKALIEALRATPFGENTLPAVLEPGRCHRIDSSEMLGVRDGTAFGIILTDDALLLISDASDPSMSTKATALATFDAPINSALRFEASGDALRRRIATTLAVRERRAIEPSAHEWRAFEEAEKGRIDELFAGRTETDVEARKRKLFDERAAEWIAARRAALDFTSPIERAAFRIVEDVNSISITGRKTEKERLVLSIDVAIAARAH